MCDCVSSCTFRIESIKRWHTVPVRSCTNAVIEFSVASCRLGTRRTNRSRECVTGTKHYLCVAFVKKSDASREIPIMLSDRDRGRGRDLEDVEMTRPLCTVRFSGVISKTENCSSD